MQLEQLVIQVRLELESLELLDQQVHAVQARWDQPEQLEQQA